MVVILAFIFVVISQTIIEEQAPVIGTLLSNGYTKREIVHHYMMLLLKRRNSQIHAKHIIAQV